MAKKQAKREKKQFKEFRATAPEEFIVEEITSDGAVLEAGREQNLGKPEDASLERNYFTHFILEKRNWNTMQVLNEIARRAGVNPKRFEFAGTKDRNALTTQLCSAFAMEPARLLAAARSVKDARVLGAWKARGKARLGDLVGNRFTITLTKQNCGVEPDAREIADRASATNFRITNYFGAQRFGSMRANSHLVGALLLKGDFEGAVWNYLVYTDEREGDKSAVKARERLAKERRKKKPDFAKALEYYPGFLKYERELLKHLSVQPRDFSGALSRLPRHLQLMFVHAFQSALFNQTLEERVKKKKLFKAKAGDECCGKNAFGFPDVDVLKKVEKKQVEKVSGELASGNAFLVGKVIGSDSELTAAEKKMLKKAGLTQDGFKFKTMPWLSCRGGKRALAVPLKNFQVLSENPAALRFELPAGSYATVAIKELLEKA
ncbi:tRNA pseudouridine(13) synthase TruD [Candidatus Micrarchaeota archaeon]|nr:tRNA pseudouridine(13) synthase TruD [Candidatus Micrarchaeota archaeon]